MNELFTFHFSLETPRDGWLGLNGTTIGVDKGASILLRDFF